MVLVVFSGSGTMAAPKDDKGGGNPQEHTLYLVEMYELTALGVGILSNSGCNVSGGVLTEKETVTKTLNILHGTRSDLTLDLVNTGVGFSRSYPVASSGVFDGCFGVTASDNDHLQVIIDDPKSKQELERVRFVWDFEFYIDASVVEHFTLTSGWINLTGNGWHPSRSVINLIAANFEIDYFLEEDGVIVADHTSLTNGQGVYLEF